MTPPEMHPKIQPLAEQQQQLTVGQRIVNAAFVPIEAGVSLLALAGEVEPHTAGEFVRDITLSAIAFLALKSSGQKLRSAITGEGIPTFSRIRPKQKD